jgi:hypothetical protein
MTGPQRHQQKRRKNHAKNASKSVSFAAVIHKTAMVLNALSLFSPENNTNARAFGIS